ncbi:hypothetical protein VTL71DRAFT_13724, partial [Oculimacula yallundae]
MALDPFCINFETDKESTRGLSSTGIDMDVESTNETARIRDDHSDVDILALTGPGRVQLLSGDMAIFWHGLKNFIVGGPP